MEVDEQAYGTFDDLGHDHGGRGEVLRSRQDARVSPSQDQCRVLYHQDNKRDVFGGQTADSVDG